MPLTEKEALIALSEAFEFDYVCLHPRILSCVPDAVVLELDDFVIRGFEVKTTRSDWLQERRSTYKNRAAIEACDYWSIIADSSVVSVMDLPSGWGLYRVVEKKLICAVEPKRLAPRGPVDRRLAASFLRTVAHSIPKKEWMEEVRQKAYREALSDMLKRADIGVQSPINTPREFPPEAVAYGEDYRQRMLADPKTGLLLQAQPVYLDGLVRRAMEQFLARGLDRL